MTSCSGRASNARPYDGFVHICWRASDVFEEYSPFCRVLSGGVALFHVKYGQQHAVLPMFEKTFVNYDFTPFQHGENHV